MLIDVAIPADTNVTWKEAEKELKYKNFTLYSLCILYNLTNSHQQMHKDKLCNTYYMPYSQKVLGRTVNKQCVGQGDLYSFENQLTAVK
jgi:hypothetical protein